MKRVSFPTSKHFFVLKSWRNIQIFSKSSTDHIKDHLEVGECVFLLWNICLFWKDMKRGFIGCSNCNICDIFADPGIIHLFFARNNYSENMYQGFDFPRVWACWCKMDWKVMSSLTPATLAIKWLACISKGNITQILDDHLPILLYFEVPCCRVSYTTNSPSIFSLNFLSCCFIPKSDICLTLFQSRIAAGSENMSWESYFLLQVCNVIKCSSLFAGDIGSMIRICHFAVHQTRLWILHVFSFSNCTGSQKEFFLISLVLIIFLQITNLNIYALNFFFKFKVP